MRNIELSYTASKKEQRLEIIFDKVNLHAAATSELIADCESLHQINVMKELINSLAAEIVLKITDITEEEQTKLDEIVLTWIRENAPEKEMTIIRGKSQ